MKKLIITLLICILLISGCGNQRYENIIEHNGELFDISENKTCWYIDNSSDEVITVYLFATRMCGGQFGFIENNARCGFICNPNLEAEYLNGTLTIGYNETVKVWTNHTMYIS